MAYQVHNSRQIGLEETGEIRLKTSSRLSSIFLYYLKIAITGQTVKRALNPLLDLQILTIA